MEVVEKIKMRIFLGFIFYKILEKSKNQKENFKGA